MRQTFVFLLQLALLCCGYRESQYRGDGTLFDHGPAAASHRYVLDLGTIEKTEAVYRLENLPPREFTLGLEITGQPGECVADIKPVNPKVSFHLQNGAGKDVVTHSAFLDEWTWSESVLCDGAFVYRRGKSEETPSTQGSSSLKRVRVASDGGWGTYFTPKRSGRYRLTVTLSTLDLGPYRLRLEARSGGWK